MAFAADHALTVCQDTSRPSQAHHETWTEHLGRTIHAWRSRIRERRSLESFDYRALRELGISRWEAEQELAKPFWRG